MKKCFISVIAVGVLFLSVQLTGCNKKDESFATHAVTDYMQLQTGKYILYRYDSLRYVDHDRKDTIISYQAKDVVEGEATDNLGRAGWRIVRYLRGLNSTSEADWRPLITYLVTPSRENIEVNENNFRYIKLVEPITEGRTWRGNGYLPNNPFEGRYQFSNDEDMDEWEFTYQDVGATATYNNKDYDSTITVVQIADSTNTPVTDPRVPAAKTLSVETYAKNVGLVYKEFVMWEYQPATTQSAYYTGFGIKLTIIDHN
jgi:hypothetical protein